MSVSATQRNEGGIEILTNGELFSFDAVYKDALGVEIVGAERELHFYDLTGDIANYVRSFGGNNFRIIAVPEDMSKTFTITGFVYKYPNSEVAHERVFFTYTFYIRNTLEGLVVSLSSKTTEDVGGTDVTTLPQDGITSLTITNAGGTWASINVYAYALSFNNTDTEPARVSFVGDFDQTKINVVQDGADTNKFVITGIEEGQTTLTFITTNGVEEITYSISIFVVDVL